jgi:hypothetical protein
MWALDAAPEQTIQERCVGWCHDRTAVIDTYREGVICVCLHSVGGWRAECLPDTHKSIYVIHLLFRFNGVCVARRSTNMT